MSGKKSTIVTGFFGLCVFSNYSIRTWKSLENQFFVFLVVFS